MTTYQTIDGVPRACDALKCLTESFRHALQRGIQPSFSTGDLEFFIKTLDELRALLDVSLADEGECCHEFVPFQPNCTKCGIPYKTAALLDATDADIPASMPQGEPFRWFYAGVAYTNKPHSDAIALYAEQPAPFQSRVQPWMMACFGEAIAADRQERNHRFLEEALELVQANQCTASEAHQLVDYVYGRPVGDPSQEVGGVMVTLAALCLASGLDIQSAAETELARIWTKVEQIRAKQAAKPAMSPLPGTYPDREQPAPVAVVLPERREPTQDNPYLSDADHEWNAYRDELKRLNPSL